MPDEIMIHDTVHGSVMLDPCASELLGTPDVQRLAGIKQLGLSYLVFPGANHTRLEHSIGTYEVAKRVSRALGIDEDEAALVRCAALLHDIGHGPFSHTLEGILHNKLGIDHMRLTEEVINGKETMTRNGENGAIASILEKHSLDPAAIGKLVCGQNDSRDNGLFTHNGQQFFNDKVYLTHLIHGPIDCDQIDYLLRDSHYTGVAHGTIDLARLLQTLTIHNHDLVVKEKGLSAVEGMLVARSLMFSSVYFHKTVRIAELMLTKAVEMAEFDDPLMIQKMDDAELVGWLHSQGGYQKETVRRLKRRKLFKSAFGKRASDLNENEQQRLLEITKANKWSIIENTICQKLGLQNGAIVIDVPEPGLLLSEPRIARTDIKVLSEDRLNNLSKMTPFSKAIQQKKVSRWVFLVACESSDVKNVAKVAKKVIFN